MGLLGKLFHHEEPEGIKKLVHIDGMVCANCQKHVEESLKAVPGVKSAKVSLEKKEATVISDDSVTDETLLKAVVNAGYAVTGIDKAN